MNGILKKIKRWLGSDRMPRAVIPALVIGAVVFLNAIVYALTSAYSLYYTPDGEVDVSYSDAGVSVFDAARAKGKKLDIVFCAPSDNLSKSTTGRYVLETAKSMEEKLDPDFFGLHFENILISPDVLTVRYGIPAEALEGIPLAAGSVVFIGSDPIRTTEKTFEILTDTQTDAGFVDFYSLDSSSGAATAYIGEEVLTAYSLYVLADEHPRAVFSTHHDETVSVDLFRSLIAAGYDCRTLTGNTYQPATVNLRASDVDLSGVDLLIVSNPQKDFEKAAMDATVLSEYDRVQSFLKGGGTLYVTLDPYLKNSLPHLSDLMAEFGISFATVQTGERQVVRDTENGIPADRYTVLCECGTGELAAAVRENIGDGTVVAKSAGVLSLTGSAEAVLLSSDSATAEAGGLTVDTAGSYPIVAASQKKYETGKTGTLVVSSCIYLDISDAMISSGYKNREFFYTLWQSASSDSQNAPYGARAVLLTSTALENMTLKTARTITLCLMILPAAIAVFGAVWLTRRRYR